MSTVTLHFGEPAPAPSRIWEISSDGQCPAFHPTSLRAATALVDFTTRRQMKGWPQRPLTVRLLDEEDSTVWDATDNVAEVLAAAGWPGPDADRDTTIRLLEAVLVTDEEDEPGSAEFLHQV